jgi:hypothetical protein
MEVSMSVSTYSLESARAEVSAASSGGAPFLLSFALTLGLTGVAAFWLDVRTTALITLFQGNVALPLAFWLERRMSAVRMSDDNPLKSLSVQLAMSQLLALPMVLVLYQFAPAAVPAAMGAVAGAHLLPYAWLQRTSLYLVLAIGASVGSFAILMVLQSAAAPWTLLFLSTSYVVLGTLIGRRARQLTRADGALSPA